MWYLIFVATLSTSGGVVKYHTPVGSLENCLKILEKTKTQIPQGRNAESTVTVTCGQKPWEITK